MPTYASDVYTQQSDYLETTAERQSDGAKVSGDVLFATAQIVLTAAQATGLNGAVDTVFNLVELPEGATVIPHLCQVYITAAGAATGDFVVGDDDPTTAADPDRYCTTTVGDTNATTNAFDFTHAGAAGAETEYKLQTNSAITMTFANASTANFAADDIITVKIAYKAQS